MNLSRRKFIKNGLLWLFLALAINPISNILLTRIVNAGQLIVLNPIVGQIDYSKNATCVAAYRMNANGGNETDRSGNSATLVETGGTIARTTTVPSGFSGYSRQIVAADTEYFTHADDLSTDIFGTDAQIMLVAIIYPQNVVNGTWYNLISKYGYGSNNYRQYLLEIHGTATNEFEVYFRLSSFAGSGQSGDTTSLSSSTTNLAAGQYHTIIATSDDEYMRIYIDGNETPDSSVFYSVGIYEGPEAFAIGCDFDSGNPAAYFNGLIYQAAVFNAALDQSLGTHVISQIHNNGIFGDKGAGD